jgi:hypothetical protein
MFNSFMLHINSAPDATEVYAEEMGRWQEGSPQPHPSNKFRRTCSRHLLTEIFSTLWKTEMIFLRKFSFLISSMFGTLNNCTITVGPTQSLAASY